MQRNQKREKIQKQWKTIEKNKNISENNILEHQKIVKDCWWRSKYIRLENLTAYIFDYESFIDNENSI
jgi:hypothetical protein